MPSFIETFKYTTVFLKEVKSEDLISLNKQTNKQINKKTNQ